MRTSAALIAVFLIGCAPTFAQKKAAVPATPKTIRFEGASQYTQEDLMAAAGVKAGAPLSANDVRARAKQLNDTGLFQVVRFSNTAKGLLFTLTPTSQMFPMHLDNLPLTPGPELEAKLHERCPLYRGQLPASGSMLEGVRKTFEEMLAVEGVKATVKAAPMSGLGPRKITAMNFTITAPEVRIGTVKLEGVSPAMQAKANAVVAGQSGNGFDTENSGPGLQHAFEDLYQYMDYAAVRVQVSEVNPPVVAGDAVDVPFVVTINEGGIYKVGSIDYPGDAVVSKGDVAKVRAKYQKNAGRPLDLYLQAVRDAYHAKGYMECAVTPHPSFNEGSHVANYSLEVTPGPAYAMGKVQFEGAPAAMSVRLLRVWKMAPGAAFDESYVAGFAERAQKQDRTLAKWMQTVVTNYDVKTDGTKHTADCVFHFAKAGAQSN